ncbi:CGNR zinc finger domain-containing protein [Streptomyces xiamenensis]|uniref:CGNR zinc finger domain-containing protein n=1 Tax=Streptomyces xiamenensis TaxID=408015 RepID=UPI0036787F11
MVKQGFRPAQRAIDLADAVRATPGLTRDALAELLVRHGERPVDVAGEAFDEGDAAALRGAVQRLLDQVLTDPGGSEPRPDTGAEDDAAADARTDRAAHALNHILADCGARPRLSRHDGQPWHLHVDRGDDAGWADWFLASSALALAQVLTEYGRAAWGTCASPRCGALFLGTGPGSPRRYCSPACASRERVAAHRRRMR